ncbi:MAG: preprotein translocase subunit TatA [Peptococcaceae bacterium BRH_c4a]|nr:MAG: preprotein translocase subunit TatA [Peptococcaceae bacterium BRH_c4a]
MFGIGPWELILILVIALVIFGPGKLPDVGKALGNGLKEFRKASEGIKSESQKEVS